MGRGELGGVKLLEAWHKRGGQCALKLQASGFVACGLLGLWFQAGHLSTSIVTYSPDDLQIQL